MLDPETSLDRWQGEPLATEPVPTIGDRIEAELSRPGMVALLVAFVLLMLAILAVAYVPDWRG